MLELAKQLLRQILHTLEPEIIAGTPIVGLEPSCVAVFRDELTNLFPHDENAKRLQKQTFVLSEFLERQQWPGPTSPLPRKAVVHMHCHHKAIMRTAPEEAVLGKLGLDYTVLDCGCCGMAGAFGFEKEHYDVSIKSGERVLLPAVRSASRDTLIIADGFSCREQIAQTTDRRALHLAQVIQLAMQQDEKGVTKEDAETNSHEPADQAPSNVGIALIGSIGLVLLGALLWMWGRKKRGEHLRENSNNQPV
jgi:Fe-S oxidoreductase